MEASTAAVDPNAQLPHVPSGCTLAESQHVPSEIITVPEGQTNDAYMSARGMIGAELASVEVAVEVELELEPLASFVELFVSSHR